MKNLAIVFLLFIYTTSQLGSVFIYYYKPVIHAISLSRQQRRMREEKLIREIIISRNHYKDALNEDGEIVLNNVLHDIKKVSFKNDEVHLLVLEDKHEEGWMKSFASIASALQKQNRNDKPNEQLLNWLLKVYRCDIDSPFAFIAPELRTTYHSVGEDVTFSVTLNIPAQPPENRV